jgi:hypothetical protein
MGRRGIRMGRYRGGRRGMGRGRGMVVFKDGRFG